MWWAGSSAAALDVYIGTREVALARGADTLFAEGVVGVDAALALVAARLKAEAPRAPLRLWLSGGLCRPFMVPPLPGVKPGPERERVVAATAPQHTGLQGTCEVWLDDARSPTPQQAAQIAVAVLRATLAALTERFAPAHRLLSIQPWWAAILRNSLRQRPDLRAVAVHDSDSLTLLAGRDAPFEVASTVAPVLDREAAESALARMLLAGNVDEADVEQVRLSWDGAREQGCDAKPRTAPLVWAQVAP